MRPTGCLPDHPEVRERAPRLLTRFAAPAVQRNLDGFVPGILDQGAASSCTGFGVAYAFVVSMLAHGRLDAVMSAPMWLYLLGRRWAYHLAKEEDRPPLVDEGARIHDVLQAAHYSGVAPLSSWPYNAAEALDEAPPEAYAAAYRLRGLDYAWLPPGPDRIDQIATAHARGMGVVLGGPVGADYARSNGIDPYMPPAVSIGNHCVAITSLDPSNGNGRGPGSYGEDCGDKGWFIYSTEWQERAPDGWAFRELPSVAA